MKLRVTKHPCMKTDFGGEPYETVRFMPQYFNEDLKMWLKCNSLDGLPHDYWDIDSAIKACKEFEAIVTGELVWSNEQN